MFKIILILVCVTYGEGYSNGAMNNLCTSISSQHNVIPERCKFNYIIHSETSEYNANDLIRSISK